MLRPAPLSPCVQSWETEAEAVLTVVGRVWEDLAVEVLFQPG